MDVSQVVITALIAVFGGAGASFIAALAARPKTTAEAEQLNAAASVSVSADARAWAKEFADRTAAAESRADRAEDRAQRAEEHADEAERKADAAEAHAERLEVRADEQQAALVECWLYVRKLHDQVRSHDETPIPVPPTLQRLWQGG